MRVVVENTDGDIFDPAYLEVLKQVNDELFLMPDVDRAWMKSIWTPAVRWSEVNEEGFVGGPVMPDNYDGSPESVDALKLNIRRANIVGNLVANDFRSSMVFVPLLERNADTGERLDYHAFSQKLEQRVRAKYEKAGHGKIKIHVIGFAKLAGDLIDGLVKVASFFLIAALIAALIIFLYTRCVRSTVLVVACSVVAVVWQLGLVRLLGFELDPFSVLVPFLIFAIGVSHGAQKMNGIMQDVGRGTHRLVAARYTFRRLFLAGLTALLADVVGFAVLMTIDIPVIKELALTASIGVGVLVFTNLILLPVLLSYVGVSPAAAQRSLREEDKEAHGRGFGAFWNVLDRFTERRWAVGAIAVRGGARGGRPVGQPRPADRRPRSGRAGTAQGFALQPGQRLHHRQLRAVQRPVRGDRQDDERRLPQLQDAGAGRSPGLGAAAGSVGADHRVARRRRAQHHRRFVRRQPEVADPQPQPGRDQLLGPAGHGAQSGPVQHRVLGAAGDRLPVRPQGRLAQARRRASPRISPRSTTTRT